MQRIRQSYSNLATAVLVAGFVAVTGTVLSAHVSVIEAQIVCTGNGLVINYRASSAFQDGHPRIDIIVDGQFVTSGAFTAPAYEFFGSTPVPAGTQPGDVIDVLAAAVGPWVDGTDNPSLGFTSVTVPEGCAPPSLGCSLGFWKNHPGAWPAAYRPGNRFNDLPGVADAFPNKTLLQVLGTGGGGLNALGRQFVAALLNAQAGVYPLSVQEVKDLFNNSYNNSTSETVKALLDWYNDGSGNCALD